VPITLGKDVTVTVNGVIGSARNVTFSTNARTIDVEAYGSRFVEVYSTGYDGVVSFEFNDGSDLSFADFNAGTAVTISGGSGGWSFPAVVTSIQETASIDGVATFQVECRRTRSGLKT
jgi:hypothetical protein